MRPFLLPAFLTLLPLAFAATRGDNFHSHLIIGPGKQFILGGDQPGAFQVKGRNVGMVDLS